jgi:hypothetical protein
MATRKAIKSVLDNFLGTFTSRYSDYGGYWLFGFLVTEAESLNFDLLTISPQPESGPVSIAANLAVQRFQDQLAKHRLDISYVHTASVVVERLPLTVDGQVNGRSAIGYQRRVSASAVTDRGRRYQSERSFFVAPHNPRAELRSTRADNPPMQRTVAAGIVSVVQKLLGRGPGRWSALRYPAWRTHAHTTHLDARWAWLLGRRRRPPCGCSHSEASNNVGI